MVNISPAEESNSHLKVGYPEDLGNAKSLFTLTRNDNTYKGSIYGLDICLQIIANR